MNNSKTSKVSLQAVLGVLVAVIAVVVLTASVVPAKADSTPSPVKKTSKPDSSRGITLKDWNLLAK
jgi:hypothetical protein